MTQTSKYIFTLFLAVLISANAAFAASRNFRFVVTNASAQASAIQLGQVSTFLPDGRVLLTGGRGADGHITTYAAIQDLRSGEVSVLPSGLHFARAWHTATVLPNGTVLLLGGMGANGKVVGSAELFDPSSGQFQVISTGAPTPRAFHSATLATNGQLVIAGGVSAKGDILQSVDLWDFRRGIAVSSFSLERPRWGHSAQLLADGRVLVSGGSDASGTPLVTPEAIDPQTGAIVAIDPNSVTTLQANSTEPRASSPEDNSTDVAVDTLISVRFSRPVVMSSISAQTLTIMGPNGNIEAKAVAAEKGMLAFVNPTSPLLPGEVYSVSLGGAVDMDGSTVPSSQFTFTTAGTAPDDGIDWRPTSDWKIHAPDSAFQKLPALQAPPGVTAISGQILKLNGKPLANVTVRIGNQTALSDETGRFLLKGVPSGHDVMVVEAATANRGKTTYGHYEIGLEVVGGKTNVLGYTIWMTALDATHTVTIPSLTSSETVVTTPSLPGLELHIPANAVITDSYGKNVTKISITPIPVDRPPFPLPAGVKVPIYFTIQPGGSTIYTWNGPSKGARLIYPNRYNDIAGTTFDFWNYDADNRGWFIYGQGAVAPNLGQVVPFPGVEIYEFSGAMVGGASPAPPTGPPVGDRAICCDPVQLSTGLLIFNHTDLSVPDLIPLDLTRTYRPNDSISRAFGIGTTHAYDMFLVGDTSPYSYLEVILPDGGRVHFDCASPGESGCGGVYTHSSSSSPFYGATLQQAQNSQWQMRTRDGTVYSFPDGNGITNPFKLALLSIVDRYGNTVTVNRDAGTGRVTSVTSPSGRYLSFSYDGSNRIIQATDNIGRLVDYAYDTSGRLAYVADVNQHVPVPGVYPHGCVQDNSSLLANGFPAWTANCPVTAYTYNDKHQLLTAQDPRGIVFLANQYDSSGRVTQQTFPDGTSYTFSWTPWNINQTRTASTGGSGGTPVTDVLAFRYCGICGEGYMALIKQVDITDQLGHVREVKFSQYGYLTSDAYDINGFNEVYQYQYYADNLLQQVTDPLGRVTSFDYDLYGNTAKVNKFNIATTLYYYDNQYSQLIGVTDPLNHTTTYARDYQGNLVNLMDPLLNSTITTYSPQGQPLTVTDPLGHQVKFTYSGPDVTAITDAVGNVTTRFVDNAGRLLWVKDALGNQSSFQYDAANQLTQTTDPGGNVIKYQHDLVGNLLSVTDPKNGVTSYTYNTMNRVISRTDPLQRKVTDTYDNAGRILTVTDRRGKVTQFTYDTLGRRQTVKYGVVGSSSESSVTYAYEPSTNLIQTLTDSGAGTITYGYDSLDHLNSYATPQGTISYIYDNAGRRTNMTVQGQPQITYTYDNANRLTQVTQGSSNTIIGYDNASRRTSLTLPNGATASYTYDGDAHLTGITYKHGANTLGTLAYAYDPNGNRTSTTGTLARTNLPEPITLNSLSYDAANQLTQFGDSPLTYDANGNVLNDGANAYTWNARNQLLTVNSSANLLYNQLGERTKNLAATQFLYDGANVVQEQPSGGGTNNLIGGGVDEFFSRTDSTGTYSPLTDALGNVVALTDSNGTIQTQYTYDPFGNTTSTGPASSNDFQYTGRENDGNGLYYYRARYYNPRLGRFISQDPAGFSGGSTNLYSYALNSPANFRDPSGKNPCVVGGLLGVIGYNGYQIYNELVGRKSSYGAGLSGALNGLKGSVGAFGVGCAIGSGAGALFGGGEGLTQLALENGVSSLPNGAVFWSGGDGALAAATEFAEANGLTTLEMTANGELAAESGSAILPETWTTLSGQFANGASGTVNVFINLSEYNAAGTFATTELPILEQNGVQIIWHLF